MSAAEKLNNSPESYKPSGKPDVVAAMEKATVKSKPFIGKSSTEIITIDREILVVGLSLQKSGLPISFDSLGKLWGVYGETYRYIIKNQKQPIMEYAVCLNTIPDYITGCEVTAIGELDEKFASFVIPKGRYIKDSFSAETFELLTTDAMSKRDVPGWAKRNNIKIDGLFSLEAYPIAAVEEDYVEMYTLWPIEQ